MTRRAKPPTGYTDHPAPRKTKWIPVNNPYPVFEDGPAQKSRYEEAQRMLERRPGEELWELMERIGTAAGATLGDLELPAGDREPGED